MKFRFLTIMHNMKLQTIKNRGVTLYPGARLSNGSQILEQSFNNSLLRYTAGFHSINEFENTVYFYIDDEFKHIETKEEMDKVGSKYTFYFLRKIQLFLNILWEMKDNNVYIRDGFLIVYDDNIEEGFTYKASLSAIFTHSTLDRNETIFSNEEMNKAIIKFQEVIKNDKFDSNNDIDYYKHPTDNIFFKHNKSERMERAYYFVLNARGSSILPMKIVSYCTALECLFSTAKTEINHRIAERVALIIGDTNDEKKKYYSFIKKAYDVRSTIVHGSSIKGKSEDLKEISKELDDILRKLVTEDNEIFTKNDCEIDNYFLDLLF